MNYELVAYQADLNFKGEAGNSMDFSAGSSPDDALASAKRWLEGQTRAYLKQHPDALDKSWWKAGTITATFVDEGAADQPRATLRVRKDKVAPEFDWYE